LLHRDEIVSKSKDPAGWDTHRNAFIEFQNNSEGALVPILHLHKDGWISQRVPIKAKTLYTFSAEVAALERDSSLVLEIRWLDSRGRCLSNELDYMTFYPEKAATHAEVSSVSLPGACVAELCIKGRKPGPVLARRLRFFERTAPSATP